MSEMEDLERALRAAPAPAATPELSLRAQEEGLLDVAYAPYDAPVGPLLLAATPCGVVRVAYADGGEEPLLEDLAVKVSPRILHAPRRLDPLRRELDEYFSGRRRTFEVPLDLSLVRGFGRRVLEAAQRLEFGEVTTYAQVAAQAGSARGARAAGNALGRNPIPIVVPCHRVLHSGGGLGGYTGGLHRKRMLLELEREGRIPLSPTSSRGRGEAR